MVTKAKPKVSAGVDPIAAAREVDRILGDADYAAIINNVPSADVNRLRTAIRVAAIWYVIGARLQKAPKANEIKAALSKLAENLDTASTALDTAFSALQNLDDASRMRLWEAAEPPPRLWDDEIAAAAAADPPWDDKGPAAWRSPIAKETRALARLVEEPQVFDRVEEMPALSRPLDRLKCLARKAADSIEPRKGPKQCNDLGLRVLVVAWREATGHSALSKDDFEEFAKTLTRLLRKHGIAVRAPSRRQIANALKPF